MMGLIYQPQLQLNTPNASDTEARFLCPRHKIAEGHIESTLFVCVCIPESCPGHNLAVLDGI